MSEMKKNDKCSIRAMPFGSLRAAEGEGNERKFSLSFSSEEPYERWFGPEILDHSAGCVELSRLNDGGVLLFNHDRNRIPGKILHAWIEDGVGRAEVEFDTDTDAELIYQKVKNGTLKGVSVGYQVNDWEVVAPGKKSSDGRFTGPCNIAKSWEPYEVSIVSVPADPTVGVGRAFGPEEARKHAPSLCERQLQINYNNFI